MGGVQICLREFQVNRDRLHIGVTEDLLECPGIGPAIFNPIPKKINGKRMSEAVNPDIP